MNIPPIRTRLSAVLVLTAVFVHGDSHAQARASGDSVRVRTLDDVIRGLRADSDRAISEETRVFDASFRDSVSAAFDSTVTADGLAATLADDGDRSRRRGRRRGLRTGFSLAPEEMTFDYTKVDGYSNRGAGYVFASALGLRARAGGSLGYAFGSKRWQHEAGVELSAHDLTADWIHRRDTDPFGWTRVHGKRFFALAGADELDYLEREGWRASIRSADVLPGGVTVRLGYRREDERSRTVRDFFTIGGASNLFETNTPATEGEVRAVSISLYRSRFIDSSLYGVLIAETAGRGLEGDLDFDRVAARVTHVRRLPWSDELSLTLAAQASAAPGGILPTQALANPTGRAGVRGYPHRTRVGTHGLLARVEILLARDLFRMTRIPLLSRAKLQIVPFADVGAAWSPGGSTLRRGRWPDREDWLFAAGVGVRKGVGFGSILSHLRLDVARRLDRGGAKPVVYFVLEGVPFD